MTLHQEIVADWIGVDWGTSNLRVWAMDRDLKILASAESDKGIQSLSVADFEPALLDLITGWLPPSSRMPVIICGMAGSRQGWREAPYRKVPAVPGAGLEQLARPEVSDPRLQVYILPGLKQMEPADVIRGEETQLQGLLAQKPGFTGTVCLPGTHSKWVRIQDGKVRSFATYMTGELFALLSENSTLRHSVAKDTDHNEAFLQAVRESSRTPSATAHHLFGIRASDLLLGTRKDVGLARLSGLLIGLEFSDSLQGLEPGETVQLLGNPRLMDLYGSALQSLGYESQQRDPKSAVLAGLKSIYDTLCEEAGA